jgi:type II secretory pathway component PulK
MRSLKHQTGSFLIFTLWVLMILSIFSFAIGYQVRQRLRYIQSIEYRQILRQTAEVALQRSIHLVKKNSENNDSNGFFSSWASNTGFFKDQDLEAVVYSVIYDVQGYDTKLYGVADESAKIDINRLKSMKVLSRLIETVTSLKRSESEDLAAAIFDWRDEDDSINAGGAETRQYLAKTPPYQAKNKPYDTLEELLLVYGMTPDIYTLLKPYITLSAWKKINLNTAPPAILSAYGLSKGSVEAINRFRRGKDGVFGTNDDGFFENLDQVAEKLDEGIGLASDDKQSLNDLLDSGQFNLRTVRFRANIEARIKYRRESLRMSCVITQVGKIFNCESDFFNANQSEVKELELDAKTR